MSDSCCFCTDPSLPALSPSAFSLPLLCLCEASAISAHPQQKAIIDAICYIEPNGQHNWGPACLQQKLKTDCFCPETCYLSIQMCREEGAECSNWTNSVLAESTAVRLCSSGVRVVSGKKWSDGAKRYKRKRMPCKWKPMTELQEVPRRSQGLGLAAFPAVSTSYSLAGFPCGFFPQAIWDRREQGHQDVGPWHSPSSTPAPYTLPGLRVALKGRWLALLLNSTLWPQIKWHWTANQTGLKPPVPESWTKKLISKRSDGCPSSNDPLGGSSASQLSTVILHYIYSDHM